MVLPTGLLQVVSSELEWVQFELNTSVVDHILSDRHCRGGAKGPERSVAWSVGLANLAVDAEAGELVDDDGDGDDDDKYDGGDDDDEYNGGATDDWRRCLLGKLVAVVQVDHGSGHHVRRGVGAPADVLVELVVGSHDLAWAGKFSIT